MLNQSIASQEEGCSYIWTAVKSWNENVFSAYIRESPFLGENGYLCRLRPVMDKSS